MGAPPLVAAPLPTGLSASPQLQTTLPASPQTPGLTTLGAMGYYPNPFPISPTGLVPGLSSGAVCTSPNSAILATPLGLPSGLTAGMMPTALMPSNGAMPRPAMFAAPPPTAIPYAQAAPVANGSSTLAISPNGMQQLMYFYPSPPATPAQNGAAPNGSYYYAAPPSSTIVLKGLTSHAQQQDVLSLLDGIYEV